MKPSDNIFFLIKSLSKTEKAYFTKFAQRHGIKNNSNYLRLFRAIESQDYYDEKAIAKKLADTQLAVQIHVYKNYLYKLILRSLHNYYSGSTSTAEISELIHYSEILKERGLFNQANKILEQAGEIAEKYEHKELQLDILRRKLDTYINAQDFDKDSESFINESHRVIVELLKKIEWTSELNREAGLIRIGLRTKGLFNIVNEVNGDMAKLDNKGLNSFDSEKTYYWMCAVTARARKDKGLGIEYFAKLIGLFDKNTHQIDENLQLYISCLYFMVSAATDLRKDDVYNRGQKKLKELDNRLKAEPRFHASSLRIRMIYSETLATHLYKVGSFDKILKLSDEMEAEGLLDEVEKYVATHGQEYLEGRREVLIFYIGLFLLEGGYVKESIHWLNKIAASKGDTAKSGPKLFSKLIILIAYYDAGDFVSIKSAARHYLRTINKEASKYSFEVLFVSLLLKLCATQTRSAKSAMYQKISQAIAKYSADEKHNQSFHYFDFPEWIESKIQGRPMADILAKGVT